jgi:hypothetical protein
MKEFVSFFQGLEIPGFRCPPLPPVMFAPPPVLAPPPIPSPLGTPVSFYQSIYCFCLCSHPAGTNEIASPLCSNSQRVRTRLHMAILQAMCGRLARLPLSHSSRGLVAFLLGRTPAHRKSDRPRGLRGQLGALHTTVATGRRTSEWLCGCSTLLHVGCWICATCWMLD